MIFNLMKLTITMSRVAMAKKMMKKSTAEKKERKKRKRRRRKKKRKKRISRRWQGMKELSRRCRHASLLSKGRS